MKYKNEFIPIIENLAALGLTLEDIAFSLSIHPSTLDGWIAKKPEISFAYKKGKAKAKEKVLLKLWDLIEEGDQASIFFYLKCQCGWQEKPKPEEARATINFYIPEKD
jgi:hypothetical protein